MTSAFSVEPGQVFQAANGHLEVINSLGELIDLGPAPNDWPSSAGVAASRQGKNAMTAAMMAQLGEHSANLGVSAGKYEAQEGASKAKLDSGNIKDMMGLMTSSMKDLAGLGTNTVKDVEGIGGNLTQVGVAAGGSLGGAAASASASFMGKISPPATATHTPTSGTPDAAAPAAGQDDGKKHDGSHTQQRS